MNRNVYLWLITTLWASWSAQAQQDAQFSLYMLNPTFYNPATVGSEGVSRLQLVHRSQYAGYQATFDEGGGQRVQLFSFNMPLNSIRSGIGLYALNERLGPQSTQIVQLAYALRLPIKKGILAIGVQGGLYKQIINYDLLRPRDNPDPLIPVGRFGQAKPDIAVGLHYSNTTYFLGASLQHLTRPSFTLGTEQAGNPLTRTMNVMAGYRYEWNYDLDFLPSVIYKYSLSAGVVPSSFEASLLALYDDRYWAGLSYRQSDAIVATIGVSILKNNALRFGYAFDLVTNGQAKSPTSHEIVLSYSLPEPQSGRKPIIRTPRFRY